MYICICNALNETKIESAFAAGAGSVADVYRACGVAPRCGKCGPEIRARLTNATCAGAPITDRNAALPALAAE